MVAWEVLGFVAVCLGWAWSRRATARRRRIAASVGGAARELGLEVGSDPLLSGRCGGVEVRLTDASTGRDAELAVGGTYQDGVPIPGNIDIRALGVLERLDDRARVETGDEVFDGLIQVHGDPATALAVLDAETRAVLADAVPTRFRATDGWIIREAASVMQDGATLVGEIRRTIALAEQLRLSPEKIAERLAHSVRHDPCSSVCLRSLEALVAEYPSAPETQATLRHFCAHGTPALRLQAALRLGDEGLEILAQIVCLQGGAEAPILDALDELTRRWQPGRLWPVLDAALAHPSPWVRRRALGETIDIGGAAALERLVRVLSDDESRLAVQAARAIGRMGDVTCERALLEALDSEVIEVSRAAAEALGQIGSVAAVLPLERAAERGIKGLLAPDLHGAARAAIDSIQSRVPAAAKGELSLAGSDLQDGRLSLTRPGDDGRVSLTATDESPEA